MKRLLIRWFRWQIDTDHVGVGTAIEAALGFGGGFGGLVALGVPWRLAMLGAVVVQIAGHFAFNRVFHLVLWDKWV